MKVINALCLVIFLGVALKAQADTGYERFIVTISGVDYESSQNIRPCYPVMARFYHSNPHIVKVRMQYPHNRKLYMDFGIDETVHIPLHENYMKKGQWSLSDFIAVDEGGRELERMTLVFVPLPDGEENECGALVS